MNIEKAIAYIESTTVYEELGSKYKQAIKHYPELISNQVFQSCYSRVHDRLVPKLKKQSRCKSCDMPVEWVKMKNTDKMNPLCLPILTYDPLHPELLLEQYFRAFGEGLDLTKKPLQGNAGNLIVVTDLGYAGKISELLEGRVSHFFNCPNATDHRKGK